MFEPPRLDVGQRISQVEEVAQRPAAESAASAESAESAKSAARTGSAESAERVDPVSLALLAEHANGRPCRLVCDRVPTDLDLAVAGGLTSVGVELGQPVHLGA